MWKYIDKGKKNTIALIPGWASDYRIFDSLNLQFNYLMPVDFSPLNLKDSLLKAIEENRLKKISIFGWSMGGFLAAEFAYKYPDLVDELILVSVRERYEPAKLAEIKRQLIKNKEGFLYKFYFQCFYDKQKMKWFKTNLFKDYRKAFGLDGLLSGLDYLKKAEIKCGFLKNTEKLTILHGENDKVAPAEEAAAIKDKLPCARFIRIKNAGHIPFLEEDFARYI